MHHILLPSLIVSSQALSYEVPLEPLPPTLQLSPAKLAQAYRDWRFGPGRTVSLIGETKR